MKFPNRPDLPPPPPPKPVKVGNAVPPMLEQYVSMSRVLMPGTVLMFRVGDWYEVLGEDAPFVADVWKVTLTKRNGVLMCGVPTQMLYPSAKKLVSVGRRVAIAEMLLEGAVVGMTIERRIDKIISCEDELD